MIAFRSFIYRSIVSYKVIDERKDYFIYDKNLKEKINEVQIDNDTINSIINKALDLTAKTLKFTDKQCEVDPNKLFYSREANCNGYSNFCTSVLNHLFNKYKISNYKAKTVKGELYFLGINVHNYISSPFFKNHDFVIIEHLGDKKIISIDPSLFDYFGIRRVYVKDK